MVDVGRTYTIAITGAITGQVDIVEIVSAADAITLIEGITVYQSTDTDSEALGLQGLRGFTVSGSGGSSNTPTPDDPGDAAYAGTVEQLNTTLANTGTPQTTNELGWNVLSPAVWPSQPKAIVINPSQRWVLRTSGAPLDSITLRVEIHIREIGS
jgi:hypothetical protein